MRTATWIIVVAASMLLTGCIVPRTGGRLDAAKQSSDRTAILPIRSDDPGPVPADKLVKIGNAVLTTLASGRKSMLIPPAKSAAVFETNGISHELLNGIPTAGFSPSQIATNDVTSLQRLESFAAQTGIKRVVRTQIRHSIQEVDLKTEHIAEANVYCAYHWGGSVTVQMQLFNLSPARMLAESSATRTYLYQLGTLFVIPFYVGTTMGRATDEAAREAMESLFRQETAQDWKSLDKVTR